MSFSINTNVASLQAQSYLNQSQAFQNQTIQEVTSGLRIVSSGNDAAGLAVANGYRSDEAVLTQGILNANNGLNQLQIADGGENNISQLLDRATTLATESASGTFTGDRNVLNSEFQSVIGEVNRQAQAIGLNTGGQFAQNLQVFIGGGEASGGISAISNGSEAVNLSNATVDAKSLGLQGVQASGVTGTDIGTSSATSVQNILSNTANTGTEVQPGYSTFYVNGPGFSGANKVALNVNLSGVTDANTLVTAINNAITATGTGTSQFDTAFKNANITASLNVDSTGKTQLTFGSSNAAFQVQAGDQVSNALLGNFGTGSTGKSLAETVTGATASAAGATAFANNVVVQIQGSGLAAPVNITLKTASDSTVAGALADLSSQVTNNSALQAAGISFTGSTAGGTALTFASNRGESFSVATAGDLTNQLGLGTYAAANTTNPALNYTAITGASAINGATTNTDTLEFSVAGGNGIQVSVTGTGTDTAQTLADQLNSQIQSNTTLQSAGIAATVSGTNIVLTSGNGTDFRVADTAATADQILGFGGDGSGTFTNGTNSTNSAVATATGDNAFFDAGGATATGSLTFNSIKYGSDTQTLNFNAVDSGGSAHQVAVSLTAANAGSLDQAYTTINTQLQQTNDPTLQQVTAVKEYNPTTQAYGINFETTLNNFSVGVGKVGNGQTEGVGSAVTNGVQGTVVDGTITGTGSTVDISNIASAQAAVTALSSAVTQLGAAQAVVGRGENQFTYATNLAQSQLTNEQTAESSIRDADLAAEAANLTKAQILIQAGVAALAQANSAPQQVLSLLRGS
jgi:flagellin